MEGMTAERYAHPARHQTKTTQSTSDTQGTFSAKFYRNKTEGFITRRDESKVSTTKQIGWQGRELWLRKDTVGIHLHKPGKLLRSEAAVQVNDRSYSNNLDCWALLHSEN
jgi:hypothetical protein